MAVLAAVGITACFLMAGLVIMTGFLLSADQQLRNFADAYASAWGLEMLSMGRQDWGSQFFDSTRIAQGHGFVSTSPSLAGGALIQYMPDDGVTTSGYLPAYVGLRVQAPFSMAAMASQWFPGTTPLTNRYASSRVRVNQVSLVQNTLYRQPVVLMLDFSSTMRLNYTGPSGAGGEAAEEVLRRVATQLIDDSAYAYNLGVMGFSTGDDAYTRFPDADKPSSPASGATWDDEGNRRAAMAADISGWRADGDGTNIEDAVNRAADALSQAAYTGFPFQKPMMILITDGEPNRSSSATAGSGADLTALQEAAAQDASQAVYGQWHNTIGGIKASVDTFILQIQRDQSDASLGTKDEDFLRGIAGSNGVADSNYFHQDGGDPARLTAYIQQLPIKIFCQFDDALDQVPGLTSNNAAAPDPNQDVLRAFVSLGGDSAGELVISPNNIFFDRDLFDTWASDPRNAAYMTPNGGGTQTIVSSPFTGDTAYGTAVLQNADIMGLYYDPGTRKVIVSGMLCAALNLPSTNPGLNTMRLRLRWGYPQLADPNSR
jgi:hypothetical protein